MAKKPNRKSVSKSARHKESAPEGASLDWLWSIITDRRKVLILLFGGGVGAGVSQCLRPKQKHPYDYRSMLSSAQRAHLDSNFESDAEYMLLLEKISQMPPNQIGKNSGFPLWNLDNSNELFLMLTSEEAFYIAQDEQGKEIFIDLGRNGNLNILRFSDSKILMDLDGDFMFDAVAGGTGKIRPLHKTKLSPEEREALEASEENLQRLGKILKEILKDKVEGRSQPHYELMA